MKIIQWVIGSVITFFVIAFTLLITAIEILFAIVMFLVLIPFILIGALAGMFSEEKDD